MNVACDVNDICEMFRKKYFCGKIVFGGGGSLPGLLLLRACYLEIFGGRVKNLKIISHQEVTWSLPQKPGVSRQNLDSWQLCCLMLCVNVQLVECMENVESSFHEFHAFHALSLL